VIGHKECRGLKRYTQLRPDSLHRGAISPHTPAAAYAAIKTEQRMATKKPPAKSTNEKTSKKVAALAGKTLADPKASKTAKTLAASALTQAPNKKKTKK